MNNSKNSVRTLTMLALLVAMSIVFSRVLSISTGFVRFNLAACRCCWQRCCSAREQALPWALWPI